MCTRWANWQQVWGARALTGEVGLMAGSCSRTLQICRPLCLCFVTCALSHAWEPCTTLTPSALPWSHASRLPLVNPAALADARVTHRSQGERVLYKLAHERCALPGEEGFPLGGLMTPPASKSDEGKSRLLNAGVDAWGTHASGLCGKWKRRKLLSW